MAIPMDEQLFSDSLIGDIAIYNKFKKHPMGPMGRISAKKWHYYHRSWFDNQPDKYETMMATLFSLKVGFA